MEKENFIRKWIFLNHFKYHPDPVKSGAFKKSRKKVPCSCCGKDTSKLYYNGPFYIKGVEPTDSLSFCPGCIASGEASKKFDGTFIECYDEKMRRENSELFERTPGYLCWEETRWLSCCDDYCAYLGGGDVMEELGLIDREKGTVSDEVVYRGGFYYDLEEYAEGGDPDAGYLFQCLHCGKYYVYTDGT